MTAIPRPTYRQSRLSRLGRLILNGAIGTLLTVLPVTSVVSLGWLTRWSILTRASRSASEVVGVPSARSNPSWMP